MNSTYGQLFKSGIRYIEKRSYSDAELCFRKAIGIMNDQPGAWGNLGLCLKEQGRHQEAISAFEKLIRLCPRYQAIGLISISEIEMELGNTERAGRLISEAIDNDPEMAEAWATAASYYLKVDNIHESIRCSEQAIQLNPDYAIGHLNLGWALCLAKRYDKALASTATAKRLNPSNLQARINLGAIYLELGHFRESLMESSKALAMKPNCLDAILNIAKVHKEQGKLSQAMSILCSLNVQNDQTLLIKSEILNEKNEIPGAIKCLQQILENNKGKTNPETLHSLGTLLLREKETNSGWNLFEFRTKPQLAERYSHIPRLSTKSWLELDDRARILILREQGIGDNILFASIIPEILGHRKEIFLEADRRLIKLYERSFGHRINLEECYTKFDTRKWDGYIPICSLGGIYRSSAESFSSQTTGYLKADQDRSNAIRMELNKFGAKRVIGISWFSGGVKRQNHKKCIDLARLLNSIPNQEECLILNLQYDWEKRSREDIAHITKGPNFYTPEIDLCNDIDGIASYIAACDFIVTISTSIAHLACALGKETKVLLPLSAIWHWGSMPSSTKWYPTAKLYRQEELDSWERPLTQLRGDLSKNK